MNSKKKFTIEGETYLERTIRTGTKYSARIWVPIELLGRKVAIIILPKEEEVK